MLQHGHCAFLLFCFSKNQKTSFFSFFTFSSRKYSLVLIKNVLLGTYSSFGFSKCALKGQQRLAQGKRSDTLGQSTFVSDAL